jgi:hypothetical protein
MSPHTTKVIKSGKMRWAGYVARIEKIENTYKNSVEKPEVKKTLGGPTR